MDQGTHSSAQDDSRIIQTTIGDLIEAVTEIALKAGKTEEEGYELASMTVEKMMRDQKVRELLS
jgi:hypothetical protein